VNLSPHLKAFGTILTQCRRRGGLSREELAERAGVPVAMLESVERGRPDGLGLHEICRIAKALGLEPCDLMRRYEAAVTARWW
jgi:transcriptional regulator with XRE-family HTH domain